MSYLETYLDSLEALGTNFDLAYSMMGRCSRPIVAFRA